MALLGLGAPVGTWLGHWLIIAAAEVIALPGLATRDRRAWTHFLTVLAAASVASYGLGLVPLLFDAHPLGILGFLAWLVLGLLFLRFVWRVWRARRALPVEDIDAVIVLGAGLVGDRPGPLLSCRVEKAVEIAGRLAKPLICSGGQGPDEPVTEASAMARLAHEIAPEVAVHEEDWAKNTRENIIFSVSVAAGVLGRQPHRVAVVTSDFHVPRTAATARRVADTCEVVVLGAATPRAARPAAVVREFVAQLADLVPRRR